MIEFKHFTKRYGSLLAVDRLNLSIPAGGVIGFVGKNGAGKSTTLRAMCHMISPSSGSIKIAGLDSAKDAKQLKRLIAYMPSDVRYYHDVTGRELLRMSLKFSTKSMAEMEALALRLELDLQRPVQSLSLGNQKKLAILQALSRPARWLLLDEPSNGLDPVMQQRFFALLEEARAEGTSIFLSSHRLDEIARYCDRVLIIKEGVMQDFLSMEDLRKKQKHRVSYETVAGRREVFIHEGKPNDLVAKLAKEDLRDLRIDMLSIEESFMHYYEEKEAGDVL